MGYWILFYPFQYPSVLFDFSFSDSLEGSLGIQGSGFGCEPGQNVLVYRQKIVIGVEEWLECELLVNSGPHTQQDLSYLPSFDSVFQCINMVFKLLYWVLWSCIRSFYSSHPQAAGGFAIPVKNAINEKDLGKLKGIYILCWWSNKKFLDLTLAAWCILPLCHRVKLPSGVENRNGVALPTRKKVMSSSASGRLEAE